MARDNVIFRLGDELSLRLPRRDGPTEPGGKESEWLPKLAPVVPLKVPVPIAQGHPTAEYPWFWDVYTWVDGEWERALAAPAREGPPVWTHGDLDARNWLVKRGRISAIIDWGLMGAGDPACDVMVAWKLHSAAARDAFRESLPTDDATWDRARGWVLSQAIAALAYYTPENNPALYREAEAWLTTSHSCVDSSWRPNNRSGPRSQPRD